MAALISTPPAVSDGCGVDSARTGVDTDSTDSPLRTSGLGDVVAQHYNKLEEKGLEQRKESRIYYMRNFNNWIKSMLLNEYVTKLNNAGNMDLNVLDIGCGKGGDLLKFQRCNVRHVVGADIAATSIEQCEVRYRDMQGRRQSGNTFTAEFHAADCTKTRMRDLYRDPGIQFDLVTCQFAFHYCFESLQQANCMLRNVSENLKKGGFFVGTTPDAFDIVRRLEEAGGDEFGNSVFNIRFPEGRGEPSELPLFGTKYNFHLQDVVDCPEFLVHFPTLVKLAEHHGLMLIGKERFSNYFEKRKEKMEGKKLLTKMSTLEKFPPGHGQRTMGQEAEYSQALQFLQGKDGACGTMSKDEWEALTLYITFAFKKTK